MNLHPELRVLAVRLVKRKLRQVTEDQRGNFYRMYVDLSTSSPKSVDSVVDAMRDDQLNWALSQLNNTIEGNHDYIVKNAR